MRVYVALLSIMFAVACGGGEAAEAEPADSAGGEAPVAHAEEAPVEEAPADEEVAEEVEEEAAPPPSGPATVAFKCTVAGEAIGGTIKVREEGGTVVTEGPTGTPLQLQSGIYRAEVRADEDGLIDQPIQWVELDLQPGENPEIVVDFPWAKVRLDVKVNGKSVKGKVELLRRGESVAVLPIAADEHTLISPGRYQGKVKTGRSEIEVSQIVIPEGATRNVPINVTW